MREMNEVNLYAQKIYRNKDYSEQNRCLICFGIHDLLEESEYSEIWDCPSCGKVYRYVYNREGLLLRIVDITDEEN